MSTLELVEADEAAPTGRRRPLALALLVALLLCVGLVVGLQAQAHTLLRDPRVVFTEPEPLSVVDVPLILRWEVNDAELVRYVEAGAVYFAVFVDRPPVAPGENLFSLADADCVAADDCPDRQWLADRGVYITSRAGVEIPQVRARTTVRGRALHDVTVVLMDDVGTRLGESAFTTQFFVAGDS